MNRGAGRRIVFRDDAERRVFVALVGQLDERYEVEVHAYCLMKNHYHLLVRSRAGRISEAMAWLGAHFTRIANAGRNVDGAIFRGRFHSVAVGRDAHLDWLYRYINANPIGAGWTAPLAGYPWSGLATTLGRRDEPWLCVDYVRVRFGDDPARLEAFVEGARHAAAIPTDLAATDVDIAQAVDVARRPGPNVHSKAEVRAARTWLGRHVGLQDVEIGTLADLSEGAIARYVERVRQRMTIDESLRHFVARAASVLGSDSCLPSIGA